MAIPSPSLLLQDTPTLRIGELSRLSGRSVHTIRWYEAQRPGPVPTIYASANVIKTVPI